MEPVIHADGLANVYASNGAAAAALRGVNLEVARGRVIFTSLLKYRPELSLLVIVVGAMAAARFL